MLQYICFKNREIYISKFKQRKQKEEKRQTQKEEEKREKRIKDMCLKYQCYLCNYIIISPKDDYLCDYCLQNKNL